MSALIALLLPLLSLWIAIALAVIDGFALPLARMKADHLTADCIQQASLREDGAIPPHSDAAKALWEVSCALLNLRTDAASSFDRASDGLAQCRRRFAEQKADKDFRA
ncbi:MAG: hypothetical protein EBX72_02145 [Betaproteobacteria bacterium]|nr:hypothetical protein [Betaproteobacteria bacterium]